jgi:hypothetical protein
LSSSSVLTPFANSGRGPGLAAFSKIFKEALRDF